MKKIIIAIAAIFATVSAWSAVIVDVFGVDRQTANSIQQKYAEQVSALEQSKTKEIYELSEEEFEKNKKQAEEVLRKHIELTNAIKEDYDLAFVDFHTIKYPQEDNLYTTIDVVTKDQPNRLKFVSKDKVTNFPQKNDIIQKMIEFQEISMELAMNNPIEDEKCEVHHCIASFSRPQLKPYLEMFNTAAKKDRKLILNTIKNDPDPERRGAAIFLVGHFKNPNKVIKVLTPQLDSNSIVVRNNAMRVIGATIASAKLTNIDAKPFIKQLNSPYVTDRNKALYVLYGLMNNAKPKQQILKNGREDLVKILYLKQPNNHDFAYQILKSVSGKDYAENNYKEWEAWAKESSSAKKSSKT